ncbi:MAG: hypothetical protein WDW38_004899 [Sanguina aurantia]
MCSAVQGKLHRGWQLFEDNTLLLVLSETDNTRMTVEECMAATPPAKRKRNDPCPSDHDHLACGSGSPVAQSGGNILPGGGGSSGGSKSGDVSGRESGDVSGSGSDSEDLDYVHKRSKPAGARGRKGGKQPGAPRTPPQRPDTPGAMGTAADAQPAAAAAANTAERWTAHATTSTTFTTMEMGPTRVGSDGKPARTAVRVCRDDSDARLFCIRGLLFAAGWERGTVSSILGRLGKLELHPGEGRPLREFLFPASHQGQGSIKVATAGVAAMYFEQYLGGPKKRAKCEPLRAGAKALLKRLRTLDAEVS